MNSPIFVVAAILCVRSSRNILTIYFCPTSIFTDCSLYEQAGLFESPSPETLLHGSVQQLSARRIHPLLQLVSVLLQRACHRNPGKQIPVLCRLPWLPQGHIFGAEEYYLRLNQDRRRRLYLPLLATH